MCNTFFLYRNNDFSIKDIFIQFIETKCIKRKRYPFRKGKNSFDSKTIMHFQLDLALEVFRILWFPAAIGGTEHIQGSSVNLFYNCTSYANVILHLAHLIFDRFN